MDNIINLNRLEDENEEQFIFRLGQAKDAGILDMSWEDISNIVNKQFRNDESEYRSEAAYRKPYQQAKRYFEANVFKTYKDEDSYFKELQFQKRELEKERKKLHTEKIEYNKWLREDARDELITEKICEAIATLPPLKIPEYIKPVDSSKTALLCFADCHYGVEFIIKDFFGNIINEYSPEIFEKRMWDLFNQIVTIVKKEKINELNIWELGDGIDGLLRLTSQLMRLKYGVIDSAIRYGDFLGQWLNKLSEYVRINFQMVMDSNHNQLRLCGAPKNAFTDENMSKVILLALKMRLLNNPNIMIIENPTGLNFGYLSEYPILGIHGEVKKLGEALDDYSRAYGTPISYIIGAHVHHVVEKETGINSEAISIRSMIGVDPYGMSLLATSNAGASLFEFEKDRGLICEYRLKVN